MVRYKRFDNMDKTMQQFIINNLGSLLDDKVCIYSVNDRNYEVKKHVPPLAKEVVLFQLKLITGGTTK